MKKHTPARNPGDVQMSISIDRELKARICARARATQRSMSGYLRFCAEQEMASAQIFSPQIVNGATFSPVNDRAVNSTEPKANAS
jgi:Ribbon-helix-helix protein, copG family.